MSKQTTTSHKDHQSVNRLTHSCSGRWNKHRTKYHYDFRGSTIALSGDNGLVTDRMEYSLYATMTYRAGTTDTPFLFNGQYGVMSDPNGLLYMRARYYNPFLCRFLNPDPKGFAAGMNFYVYVAGNPVSYTDPSGLILGFPIVGYGALPTPTGSLVPPNTVATPVDPGKVAVVLAGIAAQFFGGEVIDAAALPRLTTYAYNAILGGSVSVTANTADQLIDNGGNWADISMQQQGIAAGSGLVFGTASTGLRSVNDAAQDYFFEQAVQAQAPAYTARVLGDDLTSGGLNAIDGQADAISSFYGNVGTSLNLSVLGVDNIGLTYLQNRSEGAANNYFTSANVASPTGK